MREIAKICPVGGIVLDPFGGSGSTVAGAPLEGRRAIMVEISQTIADIAIDRIEALERG